MWDGGGVNATREGKLRSWQDSLTGFAPSCPCWFGNVKRRTAGAGRADLAVLACPAFERRSPNVGIHPSQAGLQEVVLSLHGFGTEVAQFVNRYAGPPHGCLHHGNGRIEPAIRAHDVHLDAWILGSGTDLELAATRYWLHPFVASSPMPHRVCVPRVDVDRERRQTPQPWRDEQQAAIDTCAPRSPD